MAGAPYQRAREILLLWFLLAAVGGKPLLLLVERTLLGFCGTWHAQDEHISRSVRSVAARGSVASRARAAQGAAHTPRD
jgi:hypothetical protein